MFTTLLHDVKRRIRFRLVDDIEPTNWSHLLTSPTDGYYEIKEYGPFSISKIEYCEIEILPELASSFRQSLADEGFLEEAPGRFIFRA